MNTTAEKLQAILSSKEDIRQAINEKGIEVDTTVPLAEYADKIMDIQGGNPVGEWDDLIAIWNANSNTNSRIMLVFREDASEGMLLIIYTYFNIDSASIVRTSDGNTFTYNDRMLMNMWDNNIPGTILPSGDHVRWLIVDSPSQSISIVVGDIGSNMIFAYIGNFSYVEKLRFSGSSAKNIYLKAVVYDATVRFSPSSIEMYAFNNITSLRHFIIPEDVVSLPQNAFSSCLNLFKDNKITLPNNIQSLTGNIYNNMEVFEFSNVNLTIGASNTFSSSGLQRLIVPQGWTPNMDISLANSNFFGNQAAIELGNRLGVAPNARTITFGSAILNRFSAQTKALFTNKNYTLA
jgi:hypothetical protein